MHERAPAVKREAGEAQPSLLATTMRSGTRAPVRPLGGVGAAPSGAAGADLAWLHGVVGNQVVQRMCAACADEARKKRDPAGTIQAQPSSRSAPAAESPDPSASLRGLQGGGASLPAEVRAFFEPRFGSDFSSVRVHDHDRAAEAARSLQARAFTLGRDVVFGAGEYAPATPAGRRLLAHELTHVVQQSSAGFAAPAMALRVGPADDGYEREAEAVADAVMAGGPAGPIAAAGPSVQRRASPYIKKITVHLTPPETAELAWDGTPPPTATGSDSFTVSTGKGYSDPGDPAGTCTRSCCSDAATQCAAPHNRPGAVGSCCTYVGNDFWTGRPLTQHNGWNWWTPIQPFYSTRGIALHGHPEVTGQPIGHGCVRMDEPNAQRIFDYSNGANTNVTIDGLAAPVLCAAGRRCGGGGGASLDGGGDGQGTQAAKAQEAVPGQEGELS
jgi:hypothetical protein